MRKVGGHGQKLSYYDFGHTTVYASRFDQRFPYCAYVPDDYEEDGEKTYPLAVIVHGTERGMLAYRDAFADFAEANGVIVLCPLFPANICFPGDLSSYKMLRAGDLHYDAVMLDMIAEIQEKYRIEGDRVMMYGFSGGGHFTHRFLYLHPERLLAASIGAPGVVTLLDFDHDFWVGVRDFEKVFGKAVDLEAMRKVAVQMVIGGDDLETWEITIKPGDAWYMPGADLAGATRNDRMRALKRSFEQYGIAVRHDIVPGIAHDDRELIGQVKDFFAETLGANRARS
ncbi:MAG: hydrolase [Rhizobiales bacterium 63-7]|uniref:alpha/beta hydrolase n=1 Tax=Rhizobium sp. YJ-22 TaxID=3037556 RepID=UPI000928942C|nr:alpha/beta hydrolase [Rhizobium sp. YJ-22]MBN9028853.1 alpha/beta hydrolase [Hyphomicrobiales bacterium]MDG3576518.1 alpha/beta hydrolase [Rhizobium sp. YJ-22]OJU67825.1 MAG: hydrolase [Rhizobiales bacterium 63-7]